MAAEAATPGLVGGPTVGREDERACRVPVTNGFAELKRGLWPLTIPMALTLGRLALVPVFLALVVLGQRWPALATFAVMAATDNLDGRLARRWGQTTRLGTLLDPAADKVLVSCSLVLLAVPPLAPAHFPIPWAVPLGVFLKDLGLLIGIAVVIRRTGGVGLHASRPGKVSTALDLTLVMATLLAPEWVAVSPTFAAVFLWALWWATVWAAAAAGVDYTLEGARQLRRGRHGNTRTPPPDGPATAATTAVAIFAPPATDGSIGDDRA